MTNAAEQAAPHLQNTVKPLVITKNAKEVCAFAEKVFGAKEFVPARTIDNDGLLIHTEFQIGDSVVVIIDTKEGWPFSPGFLWVSVEDVKSTLQKAEALGATIVTEPTDFYGDTFSRCLDPWNNLWWVYQYGEAADRERDGADTDESWSSEADPEAMKNLQYIHSSMMDVMGKLGD